MKHKTAKIIMGTALGIATIAVAVDYTQHKLPPVENTSIDSKAMQEQEAPCSLGGAPCSLGAGQDE